MDDKNSSLFIDPFKYPSDDDIKTSWDSWKESEKPCRLAAIKWLQCMGITKVRFACPVLPVDKSCADIIDSVVSQYGYPT